MRKTPKLIEGGHRDLQDYRHICYYFYVFFLFFRFFQNPKSRDFLRFFAVFRTFSRTVTWPMTSYNPKRSGRDLNRLRAQYLDNSWRQSYAYVPRTRMLCRAAVTGACVMRYRERQWLTGDSWVMSMSLGPPTDTTTPTGCDDVTCRPLRSSAFNSWNKPTRPAVKGQGQGQRQGQRVNFICRLSVRSCNKLNCLKSRWPRRQ